jgi:hypothetical protein
LGVDTLKYVGEIAGGIVAIGIILAGIPPAFRWLRSWKIIKLQEFKRFKGIDAEHHECEAEKERLRKLDNPIARDIRAQLERSYEPQEIKVNSEFDAREPFKNRKF